MNSHTGEITKYAVKPLRREGRMLSAGPVCSCARSLCAIAHETAGAARTRSSLRPLIGEGERYANLGRNAPRDREGVLSTPSPRSRGERVGVRGSLHTLDSWRQPLTRRYAPTSPREARGEVTHNPEKAMIEPRSRGVLDAPQGMTNVGGAAMCHATSPRALSCFSRRALAAAGIEPGI